MNERALFRSAAAVLATVFAWTSVALAQDSLIPKGDFGFGSEGGDDGGAKVTFKGQYQYDKEAKKARLSITAQTEPDWHVYSLTQKKLPDGGGGPGATKILVQSDAIADPKSLADGKLTDQFFKADRDPKKHIDKDAWPGLEIEEHEGAVTWMALLDLADGVDPEQATFKVTVRGQVCKTNGSCIPVKEVLNLKFDGYVEPKQQGQFKAQSAIVEGYAERDAKAGQVKLTFTITPEKGWHVYGRENKDPDRKDGSGKPTLIALTKVDELTFGGITASAEPKTKPSDGIVGLQRYYDKPVTWTVTLSIPSSATGKPQTVGGYVGLNVCDDNECKFPEAAKFEVTLHPTADKQPLSFEAAEYKAAADAATNPPYFVPEEITATKLLIILGFGIVGGVILNLMPCVLPVIGLKILSFAEQGGQSRGHIFALNLSYSAGLIAVFLALATIAVFLNLSWGQQFTYTWFKVAMVGLVFAMAISFLGVWEIPIPGFASNNKTDELQRKEGLAGAFFKGIFTTILATPCSGPFLGTVFGFTLGQAWWVTYLIFFSVGSGMALPYLLIGLQPSLVRWLPRPGEWMDTFKQFMGFVLLGTVVYLFSTINKEFYLPTLTMVIGIWFGCWCIGRVPAWAELGQKLRGWATGIAATAIITTAAFFFLAPWPHLYRWTPYSEEALAKAQAEGKTVMVDFTASWCQTCQWNFATAINTTSVKDVVERNKVEPLLADWSDYSDEIKEKLSSLRSRSIPLLAIYPADRPGEPILLKDVISQKQLLDALEEAGPSKLSEAAAGNHPPDPADVSAN